MKRMMLSRFENYKSHKFGVLISLWVFDLN